MVKGSAIWGRQLVAEEKNTGKILWFCQETVIRKWRVLDNHSTWGRWGVPKKIFQIYSKYFDQYWSLLVIFLCLSVCLPLSFSLFIFWSQDSSALPSNLVYLLFIVVVSLQPHSHMWLPSLFTCTWFWEGIPAINEISAFVLVSVISLRIARNAK